MSSGELRSGGGAIAEQLAPFAVEASHESISLTARDQLKIRVPDAQSARVCHRIRGIGPTALTGGGTADPVVFAWYVKNCGRQVNLFVDHSRIVQLECRRSGIWGRYACRGVGSDTKNKGRVLKVRGPRVRMQT